ncbi:MAG: NYN domain-containing protein [Rikenellaceae bacterium]
MGNKKNKLSIAIFYDGNYLGRVAKYYGSNNIVKYKFNMEVLHNYIRSEVASIANDMLSDIYIASAHYYRSRHSAPEAVHRKNQLFRDRVGDDILRSLNVESHYTPYSTHSNSGDDAFICNWLSVELMEENFVKEFDFVVLVAGSSAYLPLLHKMNAKGIDTMVVGWDIVTCGEGGIDIKTCEQLFDAATYTIVVNVAIDQDAEGLNDLLTPILSNRTTTTQIAQQESSEEDTGEREISEVMTLKPGFGFIRFPNNNLFFRASDYLGNYNELKVGDTVDFVVETTDDGQNVAKKVSKVVSNLHSFDDEDYKIDDDFIDWEK